MNALRLVPSTRISKNRTAAQRLAYLGIKPVPMMGLSDQPKLSRLQGSISKDTAMKVVAVGMAAARTGERT